MIKKILLPTLAIVACSAVSVSANALNMSNLKGWYTGGHLGFNVPSNDDNTVKTGFNIGGQVGYDFNPIRVEGAYTYYRNNAKDGDGHLNLHTWMANAYYDFMPNSAFDPYVGAGIGWAYFNERSGDGVSDSTNRFAYQGIVGLAYHVNANWALDANYHIQSWTNNENNAFYNIFNLGLNYYF